MKSLGFQKVAMLIFLAVCLAVIYGYGVVVLGPKAEKLERALRSQKSEFSQITQNMEALRLDLKKFDVQKSEFEKLEKIGFFDAQDRLAMRNYFNDMQVESRLVSARYTINSAIAEKNEKAREAGYKIFNTPISFSLEAMQDADIYKFIYLLNYGFPGHVSIDKLDFNRNVEITPTLLQSIGSGKDTPVVTVNMMVTLRTLVKDATIPKNPEGGEVY